MLKRNLVLLLTLMISTAGLISCSHVGFRKSAGFPEGHAKQGM